MSATVVRELAPADLAAADGFNDLVYTPGAPIFQPDFFDWQFQHCAGDDHSQGGNGCFAAFRDGKVIGACIVGRYPVAMDGKTVAGGWIHYWFTATEERGIGFQLFSRALSGLKFFGGARIVPSAAAVMRVLGRPFLWFELERLVAVADPEGAAALLDDGGAGSMCYLRSLRVTAPDARVALRAIDRFDEHQDGLWQEMRGGLSIATERGSRFMNWRYVDHPRLDYQRVRCSGPAGDSVWVWRREQVADRPQVVARLCEVLGAPEAIAAAFPTVFRALKEDGIALADFSCTNGDVLAALMAGGMVPAVTRPELDIPSRFQPLQPYLSKRLDYYMLFPDTPPPGWTALHRSYFTKGDSNQDIPPPRPRGKA